MLHDELAPPVPGEDSPVPADVASRPIVVRKKRARSDALIPRTSADIAAEAERQREAEEARARTQFGYVPTGYIDQFGRPVDPSTGQPLATPGAAQAPVAMPQPVANPIPAPMPAPVPMPMQAPLHGTVPAAGVSPAQPYGQPVPQYPLVQQYPATQQSPSVQQYPNAMQIAPYGAPNPGVQNPAARAPYGTPQPQPYGYPQPYGQVAPYGYMTPIIYALQPPKVELSKRQKHAAWWGAAAGQFLWNVTLVYFSIASLAFMFAFAMNMSSAGDIEFDRDATTLVGAISFWLQPERIGWALLLAVLILLGLATGAFFAQYGPLRATKVRQAVWVTVLTTLTIGVIHMFVDPIMVWLTMVIALFSGGALLLGSESGMFLMLVIWVLVSGIASAGLGLLFGWVYARAFRGREPLEEPVEEEPTPQPVAA